MIQSIKHGKNEETQINHSMFEWSHCPYVIHSDAIFTSMFIEHLHSFSKMHPFNSTDELILPLKDTEFAQDWSAIYKFFIDAFICKKFDGSILTANEKSEGYFNLVKKTAGKSNGKFGSLQTMDVGHEFTAILNLSQPGQDFDGGGLYFPR